MPLVYHLFISDAEILAAQHYTDPTEFHEDVLRQVEDWEKLGHSQSKALFDGKKPGTAEWLEAWMLWSGEFFTDDTLVHGEAEYLAGWFDTETGIQTSA